MAEPDKKILIPLSGNAASKRKAREMVATIEDPAFWHALAQYNFIQSDTTISDLINHWYRLKTHLEPLARAANLAQAAFCQLDQILLTFGSLCMHYDNLRNKDPADRPGCTAIIDSIEKCWAKADQDIFIAAVILNPFIKTVPFSSQTRLLTRANILSLMKRLYTRFFSISEQDNELQENLRQLFLNLECYFDRTGICKGLSNYVVAIKDDAKRLNDSPDPIMVYKGMSIEGECPPPLFKLAYHILSICPNSASCECLFSVFGNTLTKLRNRLGNKTLTSLAELKMHIRDEHVHEGEMKKCLKRVFGAAETAPGTSPPSVPQVSTTAPEPSMLPPAPETDVEMELDPAILRASDDARNDFGRIVESFARLAEGDQDEGDVRMPSHISSPICELFDFKKNHWVSLHERSASRSLDEELEFYELLNLDAPGDEDVNLDVDSTLDSVLHV